VDQSCLYLLALAIFVCVVFNSRFINLTLLSVRMKMKTCSLSLRFCRLLVSC